jgi:hypothetical protein
LPIQFHCEIPLLISILPRKNDYIWVVIGGGLAEEEGGNGVAGCATLRLLLG